MRGMNKKPTLMDLVIPGVLFTAMVAIASCAHHPFAEAPGTETYSSEDWMSGDDHVAYVQRQDRMPSAAPATQYKITGTCGGFPKVDLKTAPGFCVGLVFDGAGKAKKLRWAAPVGHDTAVVTDMGGWAPFNGKILLLSYAGGKSSIEPLITPASFAVGDPRRGIINEPNQVSLGPDGRYWVGGATGLYRFDPSAANPSSTVEVMVSDIPGVGLHPLKTFTFDAQGGLYVNVGAASNVCQNFTKYADKDPKKNPKNYKGAQFKSCPEVEDFKIGQGQIRRYQILADRTVSPQFKVFAKGMRNSIALVWDPVHEALIEGDNGRDAINKFAPSIANADFPHEEINILEEGKHYGWPYCYDNNKNNPEWFNTDCSGYTKPYLLLPPHAAPLGFIVYQGEMLPADYKGRLIAAFHGYEPKGHRIVTFNQDARGLPTGTAQSIVYGWEKKGAQGLGKPVGLTTLDDGSLMIVEDDPQNKILRLFYDSKQGNGKPVQEIDQASATPAPSEGGVDEQALKAKLEAKIKSGKAGPFALFQSKVIDKTCYECHQAEGAPGVQLIRYDDSGNAKRIVDAGRVKDLLAVIKGGGSLPSMPPQGWDSPAEQAEALRLLEKWAKGLK